MKRGEGGKKKEKTVTSSIFMARCPKSLASSPLGPFLLDWPCVLTWIVPGLVREPGAVPGGYGPCRATPEMTLFAGASRS